MTARVQPCHVERMAHRMADAATTAGIYGALLGVDSREYHQARALVRRRHKALARLAAALAAQASPDSSSKEVTHV